MTHSPPVGTALFMANDLIWPEHLEIRSSNLIPPTVSEEEIQRELDGSAERWRLLHPYEQRGMLTPSADTPGNLQRLAKNEELMESLQIMEWTTHP